MNAPAGPSRVQIPAEAVCDFLLASPLFQGLERQRLLPLCAHVVGLEAGVDDFLLHSGAVVDGVGLLLTGRAAAHVDGGGIVATFQPGQTFGAAALFAGGHSPMSVRALEAAKALWLPRDVVSALIPVWPRLSEHLAREAAHQVIHLASTQAVNAAAPPGPGALALEGPPSLANGEIPFIEIRERDLTPAVASLLPARLIRQFRVLPLRLAEQKLVVASVQPRSRAAVDAIRQLYPTALLEMKACSADDFERHLARLGLDDRGDRGSNDRFREGAPRTPIPPDSLGFEDPAHDRDVQVRAGTDEAVRLVNKLIAGTIERHATDLHVEPGGATTRVRLRIDGHLHDWPETFPSTAARTIAARVKVLAGLDLTERKLPQDGRVGILAGPQRKEYDLRVSTLPVRGGEKISLHVQPVGGDGGLRVDRLFTESRGLDLLRRALHAPGGVVLLAGHIGSGTTSALYACIAERLRVQPGAQVITVEDPVDRRLSGITQVPASTTLGFAGTVRAALRQDPDILVAGDVRDGETAEILLEAGLSGRSGLGVIHADGALEALLRLEALGVSRGRVGQAVNGVAALRLTRRLCSCAVSDQAPRPLLDALIKRRLLDPRLIEGGRGLTVGRPVGCELCQGSGLLGRIAVAEVLLMNDDLRIALADGGNRATLAAAASRAFVPFSAHASALLVERAITPAEAILVSATPREETPASGGSLGPG